MTEPSGDSREDRWELIVGTEQFQDALAPTDVGLTGLDSRLRELVDSEIGDDEKYLAGLLGSVASYWPRPDDFQNPYGPFVQMADGRRAAVPADLTEADLEVLASVVGSVPDLVFRSRIFDVLALQGGPAARPERHRAQVQSLIDHGITSDSLVHANEQWERGVEVSVRFGSALQTERESLVQLLVDSIDDADGHLVVSVARLLRKHRLGRGSASLIASRLIAVRDAPNSFAARNTLEEAAKWHRLAGDQDAAEDAVFDVVTSLIDDADVASADSGRGGLVAAVHLEQALQVMRTLSRAARERLGAADLPATLTRRIRESGAAALGQMRTIQSESGDISSIVRGLLEFLSGHDSLEAMRRFAGFQSFESYDSARESAERAIAEHPVASLFPVRYFSGEGRTVYRSGTGEEVEIYGETGPVWRQMVQTYQFRIGLLGGALLPQAWLQLTREHRLTLGDFEAITHGSSAVPPGSEGLYARGLLHGYNGDFASAVHLLVPRIEALVRYHLANAGERTSAIDGDGFESELGLSALMRSERSVDIFGQDVAFEIRALLCGPIGPNARNEIAHGLVDDSVASSSTSAYAWWFALKLAFMPYWNALHDADAADAREAEMPSSNAEAANSEGPEVSE